ncbi:MAG: bifunctional 5,10-methylenetetrahydrofolate dehydrogenase/5,10-methenyltetrahydrofolate cyclohydrolase [Nitrososphaerales archaeon]
MPNTTMMLAEPLATSMKKVLSEQVLELKERGLAPKLVALLIGHDPVSRTYVQLKAKDCEDVGVISNVVDLSQVPKNESRAIILDKVSELNQDPFVSAIIPQMPFDGMVKESDLFSLLSPKKDADGLTPFNLGRLLRREYSVHDSLLPCTPKGIVYLLLHYGVDLKGTDVAIIGRSVLVGESLRKLLQDQEATVTCFHSNSKNMLEKVKQSDIVVVASGRPPELYGSQGFRLSGNMVKEGSVVVGVGVRRDPSANKMLFDVDTKSLKGICSFLTPNTGGVGAMTRVSLVENTIIAARMQLD